MVILYHDAVIRPACGGILDRFEGRPQEQLFDERRGHSFGAGGDPVEVIDWQTRDQLTLIATR